MEYYIRPNDLWKDVINALRTSFESEVRDGIHVTDLVFPRKTWMQIHNPNKQLSDEECLYFIAGKAHHEIVENLIADEKLKEVELEWHGIKGTVDIMKESGIPIEFKTNRTSKVWSLKELPQHYIRQLGMYVAMKNPEKKEGVGELLILYIAQKERDKFLRIQSKPLMRSYSITYPNLDFIRGEMLLRKIMITQSFPPPLDTCESWLCKMCKFKGEECVGIGDSNANYRF